MGFAAVHGVELGAAEMSQLLPAGSRRTQIVAVVLICTFFSACTKTVRLQSTDQGVPKHATVYHVHTTDGERYSATEYEYTDSTIVITPFLKKEDIQAGEKKTRFEIELDEVAFVDMATLDRDMTFLVIAGVVIAVIAVGAFGAPIAY